MFHVMSPFVLRPYPAKRSSSEAGRFSMGCLTGCALHGAGPDPSSGVGRLVWLTPYSLSLVLRRPDGVQGMSALRACGLVRGVSTWFVSPFVM